MTRVVFARTHLPPSLTFVADARSCIFVTAFYTSLGSVACAQGRHVSDDDDELLELDVVRGETEVVRATTVVRGRAFNASLVTIIAEYAGVGAFADDGTAVVEIDESSAALTGTIVLRDLREAGHWRGHALWNDEVTEIPSTSHVDLTLSVAPASEYASTRVGVHAVTYVSVWGDEDVEVDVDVELERVP
jgi:hypothetical protein